MVMALLHPEVSEVVGRVRVDRRTKDLVKRLQPGEIAVIDHEDLDRVAVEGLVAAGAAGVLNAAPSISGRYPNSGPLLLVEGGVVLVDQLGNGLLDDLREGDVVAISGGDVLRDGETVASGVRHSVQSLETLVTEARKTVGVELERFASNTLEYLKTEHHLALDSPDLPPVTTEFAGRHVLIVVRGIDYRDDLATLKASGYLRELRPIVIGVDGGADALLEVGVTPHLIIGDFDSASEQTLRCGAELVVHAYRGGRAPGAERLEDLGLPYLVFEQPGTSEDIAMLLAYEKGAELIVAVGTHSSMEDFLDKGRAGMASTFLVRLKVGRILVDVKGVNRLYRPTIRRTDITLLIASMVVALVAVVSVSEPVRLWFRSLWLLLRSLVGL
jgi:uncharacterized membrane-anchored protein